MRDADAKLVEDSFKKYYFDHFDMVKIPDRALEREFGYQKFNSGMTRHIRIKSDKDLHLLLIQNSPSDVYCSNACYALPDMPMNEKDWKEADLIFDIDAKDLRLPCRESHTVSICGECGKVSQSLQRCTKCNSTRLEKKSLPCKLCIESSKNEIKKLSEILTEDLGILQKDIHVYFSGNEGFHVYAYDSQFQHVGSRERSELVDYIMLKGVIPETFGMKKTRPDRSSFPDFTDKGWRGRFSKQVFGSKSRRSKVISEIIAGGYPAFQKTLEDISDKIGVKIDHGVTMDIHRIFRLPGSINSKSGLTKIRCADLAKFDPYQDASFLNSDYVEVTANCPIEFRLKGKKIGPYSDESVSLPTFAAVYMICKGLASAG